MRTNEKIRGTQLRVIGDAGEQLGIMTREEAIQMAADTGMDLVEVAPEATPPVVRIMDFGKHKYRQKKSRTRVTSTST